MLRLRVDLVPWGDESKAKRLAEARIGNATGFGEVCDYVVEGEVDGKPFVPFKLVSHQRSAGFWPLVERVAEKFWLRARAERGLEHPKHLEGPEPHGSQPYTFRRANG